MVKLQLIQSNEEVHSLSQDMARLMSKDEAKDTLVRCTSNDDEPALKAHSWIIKCRSTKFSNRLTVNNEDEKHKVIYMYYVVCCSYKYLMRFDFVLLISSICIKMDNLDHFQNPHRIFLFLFLK